MTEPDYPTVDKVVARLNRVLDRVAEDHATAEALSLVEAERRQPPVEPAAE